MEPIEKAVAKAKAERKDTEGRAASSTHTEAYVGGKQRLKPKVNSQLPAIAYSQTLVSMPDPAVLRERHLIAHEKNNSTADLFRILRTKVLLQMREHDLKSIAVVGPSPHVGKSMIAANLAVSIAMESNQTVLLVDFDLRRPRVAWYFDVTPELGIGDFLEKRIPVEDILINPGFERLVILPSSKSYHGSSEIISSPKMIGLVDELCDRYESRIVIFDMPPLLVSDDALSVMPHIDAALLVAENGKTTADEITESKRLLKGTHLLGGVFNKSNDPKQGYYYS